MREIKFRGRDIFTGEIRHGFYLEDEDGVNILEQNHAYLVDGNSVALLVGRDRNGREVYEGDRCVFEDGREFTAYLYGFEWLERSTLKGGDKIVAGNGGDTPNTGGGA